MLCLRHPSISPYSLHSCSVPSSPMSHLLPYLEAELCGCTPAWGLLLSKTSLREEPLDSSLHAVSLGKGEWVLGGVSSLLQMRHEPREAPGIWSGDRAGTH